MPFNDLEFVSTEVKEHTFEFRAAPSRTSPSDFNVNLSTDRVILLGDRKKDRHGRMNLWSNSTGKCFPWETEIMEAGKNHGKQVERSSNE